MNQTIIEENTKLKAENKVLKRHLEWMQEAADKLHMENFEKDFGKEGDSYDTRRVCKEI